MHIEQRKYSGLTSESLFKKMALSFTKSPGSPIGNPCLSDSGSNKDMSHRVHRDRHATSAGERKSAIRSSISTGRPVKVRDCCKLIIALANKMFEEVEGPPR
jgi:hypothetical protein